MASLLQIFLLIVPFIGIANSIAAPAANSAEPTSSAILTAAEIKAIEPTKSGQIGINPVDDGLGDASTYKGNIIGIDTSYISVEYTSDSATTTVITSTTKVTDP